MLAFIYMAHTHATSFRGNQRAFAIGIGLNVLFVIVEIIYGLAAQSSALLADAGHNASDVLSLVFAWGASWLATRQPEGKYTYGYRRTTILASLLNALLLFAAVGFIGYDAIHKLLDPVKVEGLTVSMVAGVGVIINGVTTLLFYKGQKSDLNIKGAFLHMAADTAVSLGVVIGGLMIYYFGITWIDPVLSLVIIVVILVGTWHLFTDAVDLALDAVPREIDLDEVKDYLQNIPGVENVHDLHIWAMSTTQTALTAHLVMPNGHTDELLFSIREKLSEKFGIHHTTLQIEHALHDEECQPHCMDASAQEAERARH